MDLALVERLVCPESHEPTPLVVRADQVAHGRLVRGVLGCPVCLREWMVDDGVAAFGSTAALSAAPVHDSAAVAALLGLAEPMLLLVDGASPQLVEQLVASYDATVIALDADAPMRHATIINGASRVPVAHGAARAALLLRAGREAAFAQSVIDCVASGGRVVATASAPLMPGLREIARDATWCVTEREVYTTPVALRRGRG